MKFTLARLIVLLLAWMLLITAGCALVFRWTDHPASETQYSAPLRTHGPSR